MKNKYLLIALAFISLITCHLVYTPLGVKADSGFDSSYDSGGWSSGSDWSSSDYSSSSYSSYGSSDYDEDDLIVLLPIIIFIVVIIIIALRNKTKPTTPFSLDHTKEIDDARVKVYIKEFDKKTFLRERFEDYKKVQEDWMNFNYDSLREKLTDELYNQYEMQLDTLKAKNQKNIMNNIVYFDSMITDIKEENKQITITMELLVSQIDYIEQNGSAVRGNKYPMNVHYELTFVLTNEKNETCPNCGAKLTASASNKCEYCSSIISKVSTKAVLSKKENLRQK